MGFIIGGIQAQFKYDQIFEIFFRDFERFRQTGYEITNKQFKMKNKVCFFLFKLISVHD